MSSPKCHQDGGKFLASGAYGCIFYPHLKCKDVNNIKNGVGKVFPDVDAYEAELDIVKGIEKKIDPTNKFTVSVLGSCDIHYYRATDNVSKCDLIEQDKQPSDFKQIIYKYSGKSLQSILSNKKAKGTVPKFMKLFRMFGPIVEGLEKMNKSKFVHCDIKPDNLMVIKDKMYLIDFGILCQEDEVFTRNRINILISDYIWFPPEFKAFYFKHSSGYDKLFKRITDNFTGYSDVANALYNVLHLNVKNDFEVFYNDKVPKKHYTENFAGKVDTYSIGMVLLYLYVWSGFDKKKYKRPCANSSFRNMLLNMIKGMVQFDPRERSTCQDVLRQYKEIIKFADCMKKASIKVNKQKSKTSTCLDNV
jgi:serine/threonine protein kinase